MSKESETCPNRSGCFSADSLTVIQKYWPSTLGVGGAERATERFVTALSHGSTLDLRVLTCGDYARGQKSPDTFEIPNLNKTGKGLDVLTIPGMPAITDTVVQNADKIALLQIGWGFEHYPEQLRRILNLHLPTIFRTCETGHLDQLFQAVSSEQSDGFKHLLLSSIDRVVSISTTLRDEALEFGFPPEKIRIIYSSVPTDMFKPGGENKAVFREQLDLPEDGRIFLFSGRFVKEKGCDLLLSAWQQFYASLESSGADKNVSLVMLGGVASDDTDTLALIQQTKDACKPSVIFPGIILDQNLIAQYYKAADVFVYPTYHREGLALSVVEAMSSGLPVITSKWAATKTGMRDLIIPDETGLTFEEQSPISLAHSLMDLHTKRDPENMGLIARSHVLNLGVDDSVAAERYLQTYCEVKKQRGKCLLLF